MTIHVVGVGIGLFSLIAVWTVTAVVYFISIRTQKNIHVIAVACAALVTAVLLLIPRDSETPTPAVRKIYDELFIWRLCLVSLLALSSIGGFIAFMLTYLTEPREAQPIKQWQL